MPSRTRKPVVHARPRSELAVAIIIGVAIVLGVVLLIWLMRPGTPGGVGGGGLFNRQPRISWLTFGALAVGGWLTWWVLRGNRRPARRVSPVLRVVAVWVLVIFVYSILALIWPHGIIKHYPSLPKETPTPQTTTPVTISAPSTVAPPSTKTPATTAKKP